MPFPDAVAEHFDFLVRDRGFVRVDHPDCKAGELVTYRKHPLELSVGCYKGEIDVGICVALDFAASHAVFRPYLSRTFGLHEIATRQDPAAFAELSARMTGVGSVTDPGIAAIYLAESAKILKRCCAPILDGDLRQLEQITLARRSKSR